MPGVEFPLRRRVTEAYPSPMGKASTLAVFIGALYVALLVCTPWLIRESTLLLPPSASVSAQASSVAASAAIEALGHTFRAWL
jgi:hypothetical protein